MIRIILAGLVFLGVAVAKAETPFEVGATVGLQVPDWSYDSITTEIDGSTGLVAGVTFYRDLSEGFQLRSGGYYSQRKADITIKATNVSTDIMITSVDVPVTAMFDVAPGFGVFGGALLSLKVDDSCDGDATVCDNFKPESFMTSASLGISARVHPNWAAEAFYNIGLSEAAKDLDVNSAGIQAVFIY